MNRGYVKLWRKSGDSGLLGNADVWQLLSWCLLNATHKPHKQLVGKQLVALEPGQLIFGRIAVASQLNTTEQKIRTSIKLLENANFLTIKATNKFSIITIVNWHSYQDMQPTDNQQITSQLTNKQPTDNQQITTNKNKRTKAQEEKKEESYDSLSSAEADDDSMEQPEYTPEAERPKAKPQAPDCPHGKIRDLFAEVLPTLPQVRVWNEERQEQLRARWREAWNQLRKTVGPHGTTPIGEPELLAWWRGFFEHVSKCPWLMGQVDPAPGRRRFYADLVWLTRKSNFAKVIDGNYLPGRDA